MLTEAGTRLYSVVRESLDAFAATLAAIQQDSRLHPLAVTTTNAFASRWLVPRLPLWREGHPSVPLEVIGTDNELDLRSGECDLAIRCTEVAPPDFIVHELLRGRFVPMCSPELLRDGKPGETLAGLRRHTLIHYYWSALDAQAPTWRRWLGLARSVDSKMPELEEFEQLTFRQELHAIEAVVAGQGIALLDEVIVTHELDTGVLVKAADLTLPGPGYYFVYVSDHPRIALIEEFTSWAASVR